MYSFLFLRKSKTNKTGLIAFFFQIINYLTHSFLSSQILAKLATFIIIFIFSYAVIPSTLHDNISKPSYMVTPDRNSRLGKLINYKASRHTHKTGLHLLVSGNDALNARIAMIRSASYSVDLQYYIADADQSGSLILQVILEAAQRGVRVRILLDDLNFQDPDFVLAMLNRTKNIEVRIFNPFPSRREPLLSKINQITRNVHRLNRRMHNKTIIVDNLASIIGGRNLSDAYFDVSQELNFRDVDLLALGEVVPEISANFDAFWNHSLARPLSKLSKSWQDQEKILAAKKKLMLFNTKILDTNHHSFFSRAPLDKQLKSKKLKLTWAKAKCWSDSPEKINKIQDEYISPPAKRLSELIKNAKEQLTLVSAYFVPNKDSLKMLTQATHRGVNVRVLTNSLASTDAPAVQSGYHRYRTKLLMHGAKLFEFKPLSGRKNRANILGSKSKASLHAKAYVIDDQKLLLGSFNFDPRSIKLNTELIIEVESKALSQKMNRLFKETTSPYESYQVHLANKNDILQLKKAGLPNSSLIWLSKENGIQIRHHYDPNTNFLRNFISGIFSILPLENQL